jgi:hypothetical protein
LETVAHVLWHPNPILMRLSPYPQKKKNETAPEKAKHPPKKKKREIQQKILTSPPNQGTMYLDVLYLPTSEARTSKKSS